MTASQDPSQSARQARASLQPRERLIVALDLPNVSAAAAMVERLVTDGLDLVNGVRVAGTINRNKTNRGGSVSSWGS